MLRPTHILNFLISVLYCEAAGNIPSGLSSPGATEVTSPAQLQQAVRAGITHVVVRDHLDMTSTPAFLEAVSMDDGMLSIIPNAAGNHTQSIRGDCSGPPPGNQPLHPPPAYGQCLITVREDFLEVPTRNSQVWISNLYVTLPGVQKNHTTLIGVHGGDVYLTNMTFVADGNKARAIDVGEGRRIYVGQSYFSNFAKDKDAVIRLKAGARATIADTAFVNNEVASASSEVTSAGPVMGLYTRLSSGRRWGAAAWFQDCTFDGSSSSVPGEVAVENRECHIFSNLEQPKVWDVELSREVGSWPLIKSEGPGPDVLAMNMHVTRKSAFLRPSDSLFQLIVTDQAANTALEATVIPRLPLGTAFITEDPYIASSGGKKDRFWTAKTVSVTAGVCTFALLCLLAGCLLLVYRQPEYIHKLKQCSWGTDVHARSQGCTTEGEPSTGPIENGSYDNIHSVGLAKTPASPAEATATSFVPDSYLILPPDAAGVAGRPPVASRPVSLNAAHSAKHVSETVGDMTKTSWPEFQKIAEGCKSPLEELEVALDAMCAMEHLFYYRFRILSAVDRRVGGQGVVQIASMMNTNQRAAIKFYLDVAAFKRERSLYMSPELQSVMPATLAIEDNSFGQCTTPYGYKFPPFAVIECGQSLEDWSRCNKPDFVTTFQALSHAVRGLEKLHSCGYAHRDVKPGNILRRPNQHDWTLIDFGCTAKIGSTASLSYSLKYSPPEVAVAVEAGSTTIEVDPAIDIWAVGVIAFELLTGERVFNHVAMGVGPASAKLETFAALAGRHQLPWESSDAEQRLSKLRGLRRTVMRCLSRAPSQRPTARALLQTWEKTFDNMLLRDTNTFTEPFEGP